MDYREQLYNPYMGTNASLYRSLITTMRIRLAYIHAGQLNDPIAVSLREISFADKPIYVALSYTVRSTHRCMSKRFH
jgi:hypothetical protein